MRWKKYQKTRQWKLENVAFSSTDDLVAILKYHATDKRLLM